MHAKLSFVDLFCGAGGLSLGFVRVGFTPVLALDNDKHTVETYSANIGDHAELQMITEETPIPHVELIMGGPPCQGFSSAGPRRATDSRNSLVGAFAKIVARKRPLVFVFENVEGFLTAGWQPQTRLGLFLM